jgi:hypothetical protein
MASVKLRNRSLAEMSQAARDRDKLQIALTNANASAKRHPKEVTLPKFNFAKEKVQ